VHFHFTPPLLILAKSGGVLVQYSHSAGIARRQFHFTRQLRQAIDDFVAAYNQNAAPFEWKKAVVFPSNPKSKYSDLCK
jgi:hypothetical protein